MTRLFAGTEFDIPPRCDRCNELEDDCQCPPPPPAPEKVTPFEKQKPRVKVEKRKKGKIVTVVSGIKDEASTLTDTLTQLKDACGAGGTVKDGLVEIQGDHAERVRQLLRGLGFQVK